MFVTRSGKLSRRHLEWRVRVFGMGAILALAGMWAEQPWLINVAIGVLGVGTLLRLFARRGISREETEEDEST
jgi:hypothetical protein